jgi:membrane protease subunit (stomatin/prohibitin family)
VCKIEAQIWLTIYNMFLSQDTNRKYEITSFRKANLLRLRKYMTEVLLDQLPMLSGMLRSLEELSMTEVSSVS